MLGSLLLFAFCGAIGVLLQRGAHGDVVRERVWAVNYVVFIPVAATYAFLTVDLDGALVAVMACALGAWWMTVALAGAYARLVAPTRPVRGALWLVAAFPNTGFIGFPLAHLAFGDDGLRLAIATTTTPENVEALMSAELMALFEKVGAGGARGARPG